MKELLTGETRPIQMEDGARHFVRADFAAGFSLPIVGTPDGELCRKWADLAEPLQHNKTAFAVRRLGAAELNRLKQLKDLNRNLGRPPIQKPKK